MHLRARTSTGFGHTPATEVLLVLIPKAAVSMFAQPELLKRLCPSLITSQWEPLCMTHKRNPDTLVEKASPFPCGSITPTCNIFATKDYITIRIRSRGGELPDSSITLKRAFAMRSLWRLLRSNEKKVTDLPFAPARAVRPMRWM